MENTISFTRSGADGKLKLHEAAAMMIDCCQFQELQEKKFKDYLLENHLAVFLFSMQIDILRMPHCNEKVNVAVKIYDCKSIYGLRRITMRDEKGDLCLIANATGAFFDLQTQKAVKLENADELIKFDEAEDMECLPRKIPIPRDAGEAVNAFQVKPSHLDCNGHLTSPVYFAVASDVLKEDFYYNRVRIEYKQQAKSGRLILPVVYYTENGCAVVDMRSGDGMSYAVAEFSTFGTEFRKNL